MVLMCNLSDHDMVGIIRRKIQHKYKPKTIRSRNLKNYDPIKLKSEINNIDWEPLYQCKHPNSAWRMLRDVISELCNRHIPFTIKTIKENRVRG